MTGAAYLESIRAEERTAHVAARRVVLRNYARKVREATTIAYAPKRHDALSLILTDVLCAPWPASLTDEALRLAAGLRAYYRGDGDLAQLADLARAVEAS